MFSFKLMDRYKRKTFGAIKDLYQKRTEILGNDDWSGSFKEKQMAETSDELTEKVDENLEKYGEKFNQELEDTKLTWETTDEQETETPAVQERLRGIEDPNKLADTMKEILTSDEPEPFKKASYRLVSNRLKGLDAPSGLHRVQELRKDHLLSDDERQRLRVVQAAEGSEDLVEGFKNGAKGTLGGVEDGDFDKGSGEALESYLEGSVEPFHDKIKDKVNAAKSSE